MSDDTNTQAESPITLRPETQEALRAMFRAAGGIFYSAPKGETAAILEKKLFQLLAGLIAQAESSREQRPSLLMGQREVALEDALAKVVAAVCPGLDTGDILEDARKAADAMQHAQLVGYFGIADEPAADGSVRYLMVASQHAVDDDIFPLYRRAPRAGEPVEAERTSAAAKTTPAKASAAPKAAAK